MPNVGKDLRTMLNTGYLAEFLGETNERNPLSPITVYKQKSIGQIKNWMGYEFKIEEFPMTIQQYREIFSEINISDFAAYWNMEKNKSEREAMDIANELLADQDEPNNENYEYVDDYDEDDDEYNYYRYEHSDGTFSRKLGFFNNSRKDIVDEFIVEIEKVFTEEEEILYYDFYHMFEEAELDYEDITLAALHVAYNYEGTDFDKSKLVEQVSYYQKAHDINDGSLFTEKSMDYIKFRDVSGIIQQTVNKDYIGKNNLVEIYKDFLIFLNKFNLKKRQVKEVNYRKITENERKEIEFLVDQIEIDKIDLDFFESVSFPFLRERYRDLKIKAALIPSGGGKSYLFRHHHKMFIDIDYLREKFDQEKLFYYVHYYSRKYNRWHVINHYWKMVVFTFQKELGNRVLLCHSVHQLPGDYEAFGFIPKKKENYDLRYYKENSESIKREVNYIECKQKELLYYIYFIFQSKIIE